VEVIIAIFIAKLFDLPAVVAIAMGYCAARWWTALIVGCGVSLAVVLWIASLNGRPLLPELSFALGLAAFMLWYLVAGYARVLIKGRQQSSAKEP
jgi:uncharacterized membrane protein